MFPSRILKQFNGSSKIKVLSYLNSNHATLLTPFEVTWNVMKNLSNEKARFKREMKLAEGNKELAEEMAKFPPPEDHIILVQHAPTYTVGRNFRMTSDNKKEGNNNFKGLGEAEELPKFHGGIPIFKIERGGDVTYHGPGQLTAYFVFDLEKEGRKKDLRRFVEDLEEVVIEALNQLTGKKNIVGRDERNHGVWVIKEKRKIAAVGIACNRWVTSHGVGINLDLVEGGRGAGFDGIRACGIGEEEDEGVTICYREAWGGGNGSSVPTMEEAGLEVVRAFEEVFQVRAEWNGNGD